ncbi:MAG: hypothetical protein C0404_00505 [Verrucomicrobia bacterium]|nr:hypothetical protein [Verrucomicrobiota bacterium]
MMLFPFPCAMFQNIEGNAPKTGDSPMKHIQVLPIEDGGNPRTQDDIVETAGSFLIRPFSEDGDANYKFRFDVELISSSNEPVPVDFTIEWADAEYAKFRRYMLLSRNDSWQRIPAEISGTTAHAVVQAPPGRSQLGMHPPFNYTRLQTLVQELDLAVFTSRSIGRSLQGREIYAVEAGLPGKRPLVITARVHPYESIGSFMTLGMIEWLGGRSAEAAGIMQNHRIVILPMPNPDGVAAGFCKRTIGGLDINNAATSAEPEGIALAAFFRAMKPMASFDIHGFMHNSDGFGTNDIRRGQAIANHLLTRPDLFNKKLGVHESQDTEGGLSNLGCMAQHEFGSVRFGGSWSWYDRDSAHLRAMGVEILKAYTGQFS